VASWLLRNTSSKVSMPRLLRKYLFLKSQLATEKLTFEKLLTSLFLQSQLAPRKLTFENLFLKSQLATEKLTFSHWLVRFSRSQLFSGELTLEKQILKNQQRRQVLRGEGRRSPYICKSPIAAEFVIESDGRADFWEIVPVAEAAVAIGGAKKPTLVQQV